MGGKYNSEKVCSDKTLSQGSVYNKRSQESNDSQESLERELCLSAMMFSTLEEDGLSLASNEIHEK